MQKVYTKIESIVGNVVTVRASGVRSGDLALVGESYASVIKLSGDLVSLQVFAGTQGSCLKVLPVSTSRKARCVSSDMARSWRYRRICSAACSTARACRVTTAPR